MSGVETAAEWSAQGPGFLENVRYQFEFLSDPMGTYESLSRKYGPIATLWIGPYRIFVITEPALIEEILVEKPGKFRKDIGTRDVSVFLGQGLLVSEGDVWRQQRKLVAPSLQRRQISHYADVMVEEAERAVGKWDDGEVLNFHRQTTEMTLRIVVRSLFGLEMEGAFETISNASESVMEYIEELRHSPWRFLPDPIPSPKQRAFEEAKERLDDILFDLIDERRDMGEGDDLLYRMLVASDDEGSQMSDEQLRDEALTLFMAGHETTSLAITYGWYLLSRHPEKARRLHGEADAVLGDGAAELDDVEELEYAEAVFKESMRLYPPAWGLGREPKEDVEIGGEVLPEGAQVLLPQYIVHRDERWFDAPDTFRPERWLEENGGDDGERPRMAYYPFGGGRRICVGNHFAEMEAILAFATIARDWRFEHVSPEVLETYPSITQRPTEPIQLRAVERERH